MQKGLIVGFVLALAMVIFTLQNPADLQIKILFWKIPNVPCGLFLILSILIGVIITTIFTTIFSLMSNNGYKSENKKLKEDINSLESELSESHQKQAQEMISDDGMSINGDPGSKFFDD